MRTVLMKSARGDVRLTLDRVTVETGLTNSGQPSEEWAMSNKAVVNLNTGLEDAETVTVALLVAVGAAEAGRGIRCASRSSHRPGCRGGGPTLRRCRP